ncbi:MULTISPECIES: hypothetical protein [Cupriavidus]
MRLPILPALLLILLPHLAWGSALTTTLYREVAVPAQAQLDAMHAGLHHCSPARMLPRAVFAPLGLPYSGNMPRLAAGQIYRLAHPVSFGQRLLLTAVTHDGPTYRLRFNKSLTVHLDQMPPAMQDILAQASSKPDGAFGVSDDGRELSCRTMTKAGR